LSTPFLTGFATRILRELLAAGHIEIVPGSEEQVASFVASGLHGLGEGHQLVSSLVKALIACPEVEEFYLDNEALKDVITGLSM
jgi:hypothetical protein